MSARASLQVPAFPAKRQVLPEILDSLPVDHAQAQRSRRDLRRVNAIMGSRRILLRGLSAYAGGSDGVEASRAPLRLLELGAGDARLTLRIAQRLSRYGGVWRRSNAVQVQLLDRQALLGEDTVRAFARLGWRAQPLVVDVLRWAASEGPEPAEHYDVIVANLFLHHFEPEPLRALLVSVASRCKHFVASEPRRSTFALVGSHLLAAMGANRVTRHDAQLSVRAGFQDKELSALWPTSGWRLEEKPAGLFSHYFCATRDTDRMGAQHVTPGML